MHAMTDPALAYLTPETRAPMQIDRMLGEAGWAVQNYSGANLGASLGVAIREFVLCPPHGRADYLVFVAGRSVGVIEAKKAGETLVGVEWQTAKYLGGLPDHISPAVEGALPFVYQSTGIETRFTNTLDPGPASRQVFWFHRPETFAGWIDFRDSPRAPPLRGRLRELPDLADDGLWRTSRRRWRSSPPSPRASPLRSRPRPPSRGP